MINNSLFVRFGMDRAVHLVKAVWISGNPAGRFFACSVGTLPVVLLGHKQEFDGVSCFVPLPSSFMRTWYMLAHGCQSNEIHQPSEHLWKILSWLRKSIKLIIQWFLCTLPPSPNWQIQTLDRLPSWKMTDLLPQNQTSQSQRVDNQEDWETSILLGRRQTDRETVTSSWYVSYITYKKIYGQIGKETGSPSLIILRKKSRRIEDNHANEKLELCPLSLSRKTPSKLPIWKIILADLFPRVLTWPRNR